MPIPAAEILKALGHAALSFVKPVKRLFAEKKGATEPARVNRTFSDKLADQTLVHLGADAHGQGWIGRLKTAAERLVVQHDIFGRPYMNEWLSQPEVASLFKAIRALPDLLRGATRACDRADAFCDLRSPAIPRARTGRWS